MSDNDCILLSMTNQKLSYKANAEVKPPTPSCDYRSKQAVLKRLSFIFFPRLLRLVSFVLHIYM